MAVAREMHHGSFLFLFILQFFCVCMAAKQHFDISLKLLLIGDQGIYDVIFECLCLTMDE